MLAGLLVLAGCSCDAVGRGVRFGGTGGRTTVIYDPPETRGVLPALGGESLLEPGRELSDRRLSRPGRRAQRLGIVVRALPCRGARLDQVAEASAPRGVQFLGIDVRDQRDAAADFVRDRGVVYPSIFDPPGRSLLVLRGYPRNAVPSTIVLDRSHRVAAVFLTAVLASDLQPVVDRVAAEPAPAG